MTPHINILPYGDFDCEINSILHWLAELGLPLEPIYRYNWDFYYDTEEDLIRGTVPLKTIAEYLLRVYRLSLELVELSECRTGDMLLVPVNAYWVPYASDYYMKNRLLHYFPATPISATELYAWDPIFRHTGPVPTLQVQAAFKDIDRSVLRLNRCFDIQDLTVASRPFLVGENVKQRYAQTFETIQDEMAAFLDNRGNLHQDYRFKKWFGTFQSMLLARERYLSCSTAELQFQKALANAWRKVTKGFMKLSFDKAAGYSLTLDYLQQVIDMEVNYLEQLKPIRNGGQVDHVRESYS